MYNKTPPRQTLRRLLASETFLIRESPPSPPSPSLSPPLGTPILLLSRRGSQTAGPSGPPLYPWGILRVGHGQPVRRVGAGQLRGHHRGDHQLQDGDTGWAPLSSFQCRRYFLVVKKNIYKVPISFKLATYSLFLCQSYLKGLPPVKLFW